MLLSAPKIAAIGFMFAGLVLPATSAEAQFGYRYGWGGVRVSAPGVGVSVGRYGGVRVRTPGVYYSGPSRSYYRGFYGPRPFVRGYSYSYYGPGVSFSGGVAPSGAVVSGSVDAAAPTLADTPTTVAKPTIAAEFASEAELAVMGDAELLAATSEAAAALESRLDAFDNGAGWQTYLAFDAETAGDLDAAKQLLRRFDSVARDAQFSMISSLEEFAALRTALRVLVDRGGAQFGAQPPAPPQPPVGAEGLPTPEPNRGAGVRVDVNGGGVDVEGERSILAR